MADDIITLESGGYILAEDVSNPNPDRRQRHDWTALPVWQKGMRFRVVRFSREIADVKIPACYAELVDGNRRTAGFLRSNDDRWNVLAEKLEPHRDLDTVLADEVGGAYYVLQRMLKHGKLTLDDVAEAVEAGKHDDDDDEVDAYAAREERKAEGD